MKHSTSFAVVAALGAALAMAVMFLVPAVPAAKHGAANPAVVAANPVVAEKPGLRRPAKRQVALPTPSCTAPLVVQYDSGTSKCICNCALGTTVCGSGPFACCTSTQDCSSAGTCCTKTGETCAASGDCCSGNVCCGSKCKAPETATTCAAKDPNSEPTGDGCGCQCKTGYSACGSSGICCLTGKCDATGGIGGTGRCCAGTDDTCSVSSDCCSGNVCCGGKCKAPATCSGTGLIQSSDKCSCICDSATYTACPAGSTTCCLSATQSCASSGSGCCTKDANSCSAGSDCCGGYCCGGKCQSTPCCSAAGGTCTASSDCCSGNVCCSGTCQVPKTSTTCDSTQGLIPSSDKCSCVCDTSKGYSTCGSTCCPSTQACLDNRCVNCIPFDRPCSATGPACCDANKGARCYNGKCTGPLCLSGSSGDKCGLCLKSCGQNNKDVVCGSYCRSGGDCLGVNAGAGAGIGGGRCPSNAVCCVISDAGVNITNCCGSGCSGCTGQLP
ncbi:hypothetical protein DFJ74DRAFT_702583 [Hyaloraphidium curvatum]|nr:hypothetical protein DFJ74DRAFT_702583 [Hyaloraphidium curvatum]